MTRISTANNRGETKCFVATKELEVWHAGINQVIIWPKTAYLMGFLARWSNKYPDYQLKKGEELYIRAEAYKVREIMHKLGLSKEQVSKIEIGAAEACG